MLQLVRAIRLLTPLLVAMPAAGLGSEFSAIHIQREVENVSERKMVQVLWKLCIQEKDVFLTSRKTRPEVWPIMEQGIKKNRPNYNLDRPTAAAPIWSEVGITIEDEYFHGERYALYKKIKKYKMSEDGACRLLTIPNDSVVIDDGRYQYNLHVTKGRGTKSISHLAHRKLTDAMLQQQWQKSRPAIEATASQIGKLDPAVIQSAGTDKVAGQTCNYIALAGTGNRICYWSVHNYYPNIMERPIILKSVIPIGDTENIAQAKKFEISSALDDKFFTPPENIKIRDRTRQ